MSISAVIVNYYTASLTYGLLSYLEKEELVEEVILVDNSGEIHQSRLFDITRPKLKIIFNEKNIGFGAAVNQGASESANRYLLIVNPDVRFFKGCISELYHTARDFGAFIVGPRFYWDENKVFRIPPAPGMCWWLEIANQFSGSYALDRQLLSFYNILRFERFWEKKEPFFEPFLSGACLLVDKIWKKEASSTIFDERFFLYFEDTDLCAQGLMDNALMLCAPRAEAVHYWSQSKSINIEKSECIKESYNRFLSKYYPKLEKCGQDNNLKKPQYEFWGQFTEPPEFFADEILESCNEPKFFEFGVNDYFVPFFQADCNANCFVFPGTIWEKLEPGVYFARLRSCNLNILRVWKWEKLPEKSKGTNETLNEFKRVKLNNKKAQNQPMFSLPEPFNLYKTIFKSDHMHFGYWENLETDLSLEDAQEKMFVYLVSLMPEPPAQVLDVGCGMGLSSYKLAEMGYLVKGIAPDREMVAYAKKYFKHENCQFHAIDFLDCDLSYFENNGFDVLLFQESLQYLHPMERVFKISRELLKPEGTLIIADEVRLDPGLAIETAVHYLPEIISKIMESGFRISHEKYIGEYVQKTCDHIIQRFLDSYNDIFEQIETQNFDKGLEHYLSGWRKQKKWYADKSFDYIALLAHKDKIFFQTYQKGDEHKIIPLFNQVFSQNRSYAHWNWKFRENPFGNYKIAEAVDEQEVLAGHYCGYCIKFYSAGPPAKEEIVFQGGDTMTNPDYRGQGMRKTSILSRLAKYFYNKFCIGQVPFFYGFNTGSIRKFGERFLKYEYLQTVPYLKLDTKCIDFNFFIRSKFKLYGLKVNKVDFVTEDYDTFFAKVAGDYRMLVKRDLEYLRWRYLQSPDNEYLFYELRHHGRLAGWGVFAISDCALIWGDALFDKNYLKCLGYFLAEVKRLFHPHIKNIEGWFSQVPDWWWQGLGNIGFETELEPNGLAPAIIRFDPEYPLSLFEENFYYTKGDSDLF